MTDEEEIAAIVYNNMQVMANYNALVVELVGGDWGRVSRIGKYPNIERDFPTKIVELCWTIYPLNDRRCWN